MSEEEKKAINDLLFIVITDVYDNEVNIDKTKILNEYNKSVGVVLNLIEKQQNIINDMAEELVNGIYDFKSKKQVIDHFTNKYEEGKHN